jgi:predicted PurR-regulated permease PerM
MEKQPLEINWSSLWRVLIMVIFAVALFYMRSVLGMLVVAVIISSALHGPVTYLEKKKIPRLLSVIMIYLVGIGVTALLLYTIVPVTLIQLKYLLSHFNDLKIPILDVFGSSEIVSKIDQGISGLIDTLFYGGGTGLAGFLSVFLRNIFFVGLSLVLAFYLTLSRDGVEKFIRAILPASKEDYAVNLYIRTRRKLGRWLSGQLVISFIVGFLTFIGLLILGVDYSLVLALIAAIFELIPYVGPIAVGAITFLITLPQSLSTALLAVLIFFIIQQLEGHVLVPFVMSKAIGTDPLVIVIAMLAGAEIAGIVGVLLAVPVSIIFGEVVNEWSARKRKLKEAP